MKYLAEKLLILSDHLMSAISALILTITISVFFIHDLPITFANIFILFVFSFIFPILTSEGIILARDGKNVLSFFFGGLEALLAGKKMKTEDQIIDLMPGENLLGSCRVYQKKWVGYCPGELTLTSERVIFKPRLEFPNSIFKYRISEMKNESKFTILRYGRWFNSIKLESKGIKTKKFLVPKSFQIHAT